MEQWQIDAIRRTESGADWFAAFEHELEVRNAAHDTRQRRLDLLASRIIQNGDRVRSWDNGIRYGTEYMVPCMMGTWYTLHYWNSTGSRDEITARYWSSAEQVYKVRVFRGPFTWSESVRIPAL
jgi:hypothetical protein